MLKVHVPPGEEVMATLQAAVDDAGIRNGAVVSLIGALDGCCISNMPRDDATKDVLTELNSPFELSGTGEITDGKVHLHVVLGTDTNQALAGHLHWGKVQTWFVNAYVQPLD